MNQAQFLLGFLLAVAISLLSYAARSLSLSGAVTAVVLGTVVFGLGGLGPAVLLIGFFVSASLLSRVFRNRKRNLAEKFSKGDRRDWEQVLANGGIAGLFVLLSLAFREPWTYLALAGTLAAVNADTWATELGVLNPTPPRLVTTGKPVERGTSGAISLVGTLAALAGALFIAILAVIFWPGNELVTAGRVLMRLFAISLAGLLGSLVDSLLGATIQAIYTCPSCQKETERHPRHTCGAETVLKRGWHWMNNDWVNGVCALVGALVAGAFALALPQPLGLFATLEGGPPMVEIHLSSPAFADGETIPVRFTCDGENLSPALNWSGIPTGARSLALIVEDPDAPLGTFVHWVIYNMMPNLSGLPQGVPTEAVVKNIGLQGSSGFRKPGYGGPCPPSGKPHRYYFTLYALDLDPRLPPGLNANELKKMMKGHILGQGQWMGKYGRK